MASRCRPRPRRRPSAPHPNRKFRMNRREMIRRTGAATLGLGLAARPWQASAQAATKKILFFSKSSAYEHAVIKRNNGKPSFVEQILTELGPKHGFEFT